MIRSIFIFLSIIIGLAWQAGAQMGFESDTLETSEGRLKITFIGHGSLMFTFDKKIIHVDPFTRLADYAKLPKADMILLTHHHRDHLDQNALGLLRTEKTQLVLTETCAKQVQGGLVMHNGDVKTIGGLKIEAVPAYNIVHMRSQGVTFHPKGVGNGYIITFGDKRVYKIECAFLPMNLPYTMTPEMVADAAKAFKPKILYPYHYGNTDTSVLLNLMKDVKDVDVRIRKMQ
jgi:L-ascorbate metabolism protein UlaG (beta-lactamase superfamily)